MQAQTVWDAPKKAIEQSYGDIKVYLRATQQEGQFEFKTYNEANIDHPMVRFVGSCHRVMGFDVMLSSHIMKDIVFKTPAYETDKTVKNLRVQTYIDATRKAIQSQCPDVEIIYIRLTGGGVYNQATIAKAHDWKLEEGILEKEDLLVNFDVNIDFFDTNVSYYGTTYAANCSKNAEVTLKRSYKMPAYKKGSNPDPSVIELVSVAKRVVREYQAQCSKIENIKFTLYGVNNQWLCPEGVECYLEADEKDDMRVNIIGYERNRALTENALIKSYDDVMKYLRVGDFKTLKQYPFMTELFYETFLVEYSKMYAANIPNPKRRDIIQISERYDNNGYKVSENASLSKTIYIEAKYAAKFDQVFVSNEIGIKGMMLGRVIDARNRQDMSPVVGFIFGMLDDETSITNFLQGKPRTSKEVTIIYDNLYSLMH